MTETTCPFTYRLPESLNADLEKLRGLIADLKDGRVSAAELRVFRVPLGIYEQREAGTFMLRVRLPAGCLLPHQMRKLAEVSRRFGNGVLHVTTRQDIQVHQVPLEKVHQALVKLKSSGLSTKGGGGNTVRNVTACSDAGVCTDEAFDVSPHAVAVTEFLLPDPANYQLPRKYKIAFSGCGRDCAGATVNDLGFIAKRRGDTLGFAVYVAGGMGAKSRVADLLDPFVSTEEAHLVAEAVKRVFDKHGNRKNRHKARLRFLVDRIGFEGFRDLYEAELSELKADPPKAPRLRELPRREETAGKASSEHTEAFLTWRDRNSVPQKQAGYSMVHIPLVLGDITADTIERLAAVVEFCGEGMVRTTQWQNLLLRWVPASRLPQLQRELQDLGLAGTPARVLCNTIACAGASTCKLGICLSRGLARAITRELERSSLDLDGLGDLRIHISGCPNSCGRHPIGDIGLFGAARRREGRLVPHYILTLGGRVGESRTRLAEGNVGIPARNVPAFLAEFLKTFQEAPQYPDFHTFVDADGRQVAADLAAGYKGVPSFEEDKNYYFDWGAEDVFSLAGRGPGECGAGVFELIEVDLHSARDAIGSGDLCAATVLGSRALLVTQGLEAANDREALTLFNKHFVDPGFVSSDCRPLIDEALKHDTETEPRGAFRGTEAQVSAFVESVQKLYDNMDPSLHFKAETAPKTGPTCAAGDPEETTPREEVAPDREADFRGVVCPLNYVKTKLLLEQMAPGQALAVLLDDEGARNVPQSAEQDGHQALAVVREGDHWRVVIRKGDR